MVAKSSVTVTYSVYPPLVDSPNIDDDSHRYSFPFLQYWHFWQASNNGVIPALSPTLNFVTLSPISTTLPTTSCPGTVGSAGGIPMPCQSPSIP